MTDDLRPQCHPTPERGWMNDPNGLARVGDTYHAYFQHNPDGSDWGNMSWGHLTSSDLVAWTEHPVALRYLPDEMVFSGSIVVDDENTSGFRLPGAEADPLVAIYTSVSDAGAQTQALAYSNDGGYAWMRYADNPVLDRGSSDFRDPKVTRFTTPGGESFWLMTVVEAVDRAVLFYRSENLRDWRFLSSFTDPRDAAADEAAVWECPDLVRLRIDGTDDPDGMVWALILSVNPAGPDGGSATVYFVGDFDGRTFSAHADHPRRLDHGTDYYAATTFSGLEPGRVVTMAWMSNWRYASQIPTDPWRGSLTLARELTARRLTDRDGIESVVLCQQAPPELDRVFADSRELVTVPFVVNGRRYFDRLGAARLRVAVDPGDADRIEMGFFGSCEAETPPPVTIRYSRLDGALSVERRAAGAAASVDGFEATVSTPAGLVGGVLDLVVWLDTASIEVQSADGTTWLTMLVFPDDDNDGWSITAVGGSATVLRLEAAHPAA